MFGNLMKRAAASMVTCALASIGLLGIAKAAAPQTSLVTYEAIQLPGESNPPFQALDGVTGTRSVANGFLTMSVAAPSGSINNVRYDPLFDVDSAAFEFRVKVDSS